MRNGKHATTDYYPLVIYTEFRRKKPAFYPVLYERQGGIRHQLMLKFEFYGFVFEITNKLHKTVYGCHFLFVHSRSAQSYRTRRRYAHKRENVKGFLCPLISDEKLADHVSGEPDWKSRRTPFWTDGATGLPSGPGLGLFSKGRVPMGRCDGGETSRVLARDLAPLWAVYRLFEIICTKVKNEITIINNLVSKLMFYERIGRGNEEL